MAVLVTLLFIGVFLYVLYGMNKSQEYHRQMELWLKRQRQEKERIEASVQAEQRRLDELDGKLR